MRFEVDIAVSDKNYVYEIVSHSKQAEVDAARKALKFFEDSGLASSSSVLPLDFTLTCKAIRKN